ncbi:MAG: mechanosensitive ion channel family protein [Candidatus Izemoplasmataceae bacterium]|mgnify:CR=1 FL=1
MTGLREYLVGYLEGNGVNVGLSSAIIAIVAVLLWIIVGIIFIKISKVVVFRIMRPDKHGVRSLTIAKLLSNLLKYLIWFVVAIISLTELNVDITPFIASAGVVGLAIGFGAQEIVKDFITGFFIIFDQAFDVGDIIEVDGFKGSVQELGLRVTRIRNWKGELKIINNGDIQTLINYSKADSIAIVDFGVAYETDLLKLQDLIEPLLNEIKEAYEDITDMPSFLGVTELASSSINLRIIAKTKPMTHFAVERGIRKDIVVYFKKHGIEIPFPQIVVHNG